jgi:ABC-type polysaccharide/polyol phosphate export permease
MIIKHFGESNLTKIDLIRTLVKRDLTVKYRGSILGYLWSMINPLLFMVVISLVFSQIVRDVPYYSLFALSGFLFWNLTSNSIMASTHSIVQQSALLRKVKMSAWTLTLVPLFTFCTNFLLSLVPYTIICFYFRLDRVPYFWQLLPVLLLLLVFLSGVALTLSSINVMFRDVGHFIEPILAMAMYATPIVYNRFSPSFSDRARELLGYNPMTHFVEAGRSSLFYQELISLERWSLLLALSFTSITVGVFVYRKLSRQFIYNI